MKRLALIQHEVDSPAGSARPWLNQRGFRFQHVELFKNQPLPKPDDVDDLILCGGSMNVDEEHHHPWLKEEKKLIEAVLKKGGRVVGLCLGAQLTAEVLGAKVGPHTDWEVGWHPVQLKQVPGLQGFETPRELSVFQWHRYVFEIPDGAQRIASNDWWENQAYLWKKQALCFQFHPETDLAWNRECALDRGLPSTGRSQTAEQILEQGPRLQPTMQAWFESVLEGFLIIRPE